MLRGQEAPHFPGQPAPETAHPTPTGRESEAGHVTVTRHLRRHLMHSCEAKVIPKPGGHYLPTDSLSVTSHQNKRRALTIP